MLSAPWVYIVALLAAFVIATLASPVGVEQTTVFAPEDVIPVPCHPDSLAMAYALKLNGRVVPLTGLIDPLKVDAVVGHTVLMYLPDPVAVVRSVRASGVVACRVVRRQPRLEQRTPSAALDRALFGTGSRRGSADFIRRRRAARTK
jgi:hypothetical protein